MKKIILEEVEVEETELMIVKNVIEESHPTQIEFSNQINVSILDVSNGSNSNFSKNWSLGLK